MLNEKRQDEMQDEIAANIADGENVDVTRLGEDAYLVGIIDQMVASGIMQAGCRQDQNF